MASLLEFIFLTCCLTFGVLGDPKPDVSHIPGYGFNRNSPAKSYLPARDSGPCNECRTTQRCTSELDIRDSEVPKEVAIPTIDYQIVYKDKPVQVVTDFEIRENLCPVPVQLQDQQIRIEPIVRTVEKIVTVRVPRITENVVYKKVDRIKLVTEYRKKPKVVKLQHTRQVPDPVTVPQSKNVIRKKVIPQVDIVPVPVRIANQVDVHIERIDKPVDLPAIQFRFCEHVQEIQVKASCPPAEPQTKKDAYLPPIAESTSPKVGYALNNRQSDNSGWVPAPARRFYRSVRSFFK